jgi:preprotein translocase subunit SecE
MQAAHPSPFLEPTLEPDAPTSSQTTPVSGAAESGATSPVGVDATGVPLAEADGGFAAATVAELRRVVWPSRQQLFSESVAVILMVGLSAAAIAALDRFYGWAATQVFR